MSILLYIIGGMSLLAGFLLLAPHPEPSYIIGLWVMVAGLGTVVSGHVIAVLENIRDQVS